ncbi:MAG TPA: dTDP-4-dehydrorhamnose 3,5-epimerase [Bacteroidales bacterium]|nr:dTDP-4-dehydrorhamnose 3,5-epimerase [Bacteroidales bacterium]HSA44147.1 dTDP-4-dehydrorhamnose 3,5-epimerase [Bacteroidales bacterium]
MQINSFDIRDVKLFTPSVYRDERGSFLESYSKRNLLIAGFCEEFVQDNQSISHKNVLRGLHFQFPPYSQGKLVRVVRGAVLDVAVDLRKDSPTFGKYVAVELSAENNQMLWIPSGFAHGFLSLADDSVFLYKCTAYYHRESEGCILWNDPLLNIDWGITDPLVSLKDSQGMLFEYFSSPF